MNVLRPIFPLALLLAASLCSLPGCGGLAERAAEMLPGGDRAERQPRTRPVRNVVSAVADGSQLRILRDATTLAVLKPSKPLIVKYGFWNGTEQVVIRCTDAAGTTALELFNVKGGQRVASIPAESVKDGKPDWAAAAAQ